MMVGKAIQLSDVRFQLRRKLPCQKNQKRKKIYPHRVLGLLRYAWSFILVSHKSKQKTVTIIRMYCVFLTFAGSLQWNHLMCHAMHGEEVFHDIWISARTGELNHIIPTCTRHHQIKTDQTRASLVPARWPYSNVCFFSSSSSKRCADRADNLKRR